jgi:hypothetical protein
MISILIKLAELVSILKEQNTKGPATFNNNKHKLGTSLCYVDAGKQKIPRFLYPMCMHPGRICKCRRVIIKGHGGPGGSRKERERSLF